MKYLKALAVIIALSIPAGSFAQKIKLIEGKIPADLKKEKSVNIEFSYENMGVGKFDKEEEYVATKREEYNKAEAGRGDKWADNWVYDRVNRFEPRFITLFKDYSKLDVEKDSRYTIIFYTVFTEPGFNVGIYFANKSAYIDGEALIVETADKNRVLAKLAVTKAPGRAAFGMDFDTGLIIGESYATAGRTVGKFIKK